MKNILLTVYVIFNVISLITALFGTCSVTLGKIRCLNTPCKNGGTCAVNYINCTPYCKCIPTFTGALCETSILNYTICNETGLACYEGACQSPVLDKECTCDAGWHGAHCNVSMTDVTTEVSIPKNYTTCVGNIHCYNGQCVPGLPRCMCNDDWVGLRCDKYCNLTCLYGASCVYLDNIPRCNCPWNDTHDFISPDCRAVMKTMPTVVVTSNRTRLLSQPNNSYWIPVGTVVGVFVLLIVFFVVICTIMWRKRVIFIMKLVHRFKSYDDNEDKEFDAFVSYKSSSADHTSSPEELFVINELMPKLETEFGFRLCVHFRDFIPGLDISDNVLKAIENSHRTIMIISRAYIESSIWTRFEYEQAQIAVISQKQRIIPILFEEIGDLASNDPTLKVILSSTTYLEKPADPSTEKKNNQFWTRLQLSMPKKRPVSSYYLTTLGNHNVSNNKEFSDKYKATLKEDDCAQKQNGLVFTNNNSSQQNGKL